MHWGWSHQKKRLTLTGQPFITSNTVTWLPLLPSSHPREHADCARSEEQQRGGLRNMDWWFKDVDCKRAHFLAGIRVSQKIGVDAWGQAQRGDTLPPVLRATHQLGSGCVTGWDP